MEQPASSLEEATKQIADNQFGDGATIHQGHNNITFNLDRTNRPARAIRLIPYPRNEDLIHRPDLVDKLNRLLPYSSATSQSAALWGLGGSGKTQIALNYAYQRSADASCSVLWVHADTEATFSQDYKSIARKLQINKSNLSNEDLLRAVRDGIEALPKWVLVVDNADDLKLFGVGQTAEKTKTLFQYIPHASTGTVLWTTRDAHITGTLVGQRQGIEVARMRFNEAKQLLMSFFGSAESSIEEAENGLLIEELQSLPLAIMQAGTYMSRTSTTPKEYLALLAQRKKRWDLLKMDDLNRHRRPNVPNNVLETWSISITRIRQESETAYKVLHVIAYVSNENIPHEMITTTLGHINEKLRNKTELLELEATKVITRLKEFSFIGIRQAEDGSRNYEMHKLVQEAVRYGLSVRKSISISETDGIKSNFSTEKSETQTSRHKTLSTLKGFVKRMSVELGRIGAAEGDKHFSTIALQVTSDLFPASNPDTWIQCERFLAHVLQIGEWADVNEKQVETAQLLEKASLFLLERGRWREKEHVNEMVLKYRQKMLGDRHPDTIRAIANLASTYHGQGRYSEAEPLKVQVLDSRREILGDRHPDTIRAIANLASTYHGQGRYSKAEALEIQVLDSRREILGDRHPDTIKAISNLAATYFKQGRYSEAEPLNIQVLDSRREILGDRHPDTILAIANLASTYHAQGRYSEAEPLKVQVLDIQQEILRDRHPDTIQAIAELAATYYQQGRLSEAEALEVQVLDSRREILGDRHPDTILTMSNLAWSWYRMSRHEDATALMQRALEYGHSILGPDHPQTKQSAKDLQYFASHPTC